MATKFVLGLGIVTVPDKIEKGIPRQVLKTLAEDASGLSQEEQGHTQKYVVDQGGELVQRATAVVKHELLYGHKHDELTEADANAVKEKPGEVFDGEGDDPGDLAELSESDAVDLKPGEVFGEDGEPDEVDKLSIVEVETGVDGEDEAKDEGDSDAGDLKEVTDKSQAVEVGQTITVVTARQEAVVKAVHDDVSFDVAVGDQTFSVKAYEVMPA